MKTIKTWETKKEIELKNLMVMLNITFSLYNSGAKAVLVNNDATEYILIKNKKIKDHSDIYLYRDTNNKVKTLMCNKEDHSMCIEEIKYLIRIKENICLALSAAEDIDK